MQENPNVATVSTRWFVYIFAAYLLIGAADAVVLRAADSKRTDLFKNLSAPYLSFLDDVFNFLDGVSGNVTEGCRSDTKKLIDLAQNGDTSSLKVFDASGKPSSGILEGGVAFIGLYSECVKTVVQSEETFIQSKYCLINFNASAASSQEELPKASWMVMTEGGQPTIGLCVPLSCSTEDVQYATNASLHQNFRDVDGHVAVCHTDETGMFKDPGAVIIFCIFLIFFVIAIIGTVIDYVLEYTKSSETTKNLSNENKSVSMAELVEKEDSSAPPSLVVRCLLAFSFKTNVRKIFTVVEGDNDIRAIHGVKFLSMALIIFGHTFSFATTNLFFVNPGIAKQAPKGFLTQIFANGTFAVDTFYLISGILVSFVGLKAMAKMKGKLSLLYFYFHRYFRLTPLFLAVILFCAYLLQYMSSGPNWLKSIEMYDSWCRQNGWINVLYLHNFIRTENMCLSHTWYLATDMQMYLLTPLILIPLYRNINYGLIPMGAFLFVTIVTTAVITALNHYPAIPYINDAVPIDVLNDYYKNVYIKTYCRMGPYIIGIAIGYLFWKNKNLILSKRAVATLWCASLALGLTIIYLMWPANQGILPSNSEAAAYSALARTLWGISTGWIIIACKYKYGGIVNTILSCSIFVPLSRLTYCAYLIHPVVMNVYYGSTETAIMLTSSYAIYTFLGNICITFVISTFLSALFESPFINLEKIILTRGKTS